MKYIALVRYIAGETVSQKSILILCSILTLLLVLFIFGIHVEGNKGIVHSFRILGGKPVSVGDGIQEIPVYAGIYTTFGFLTTVLLCLVATAQVIPEALLNGGMLFFIAQPLSRAVILLGFYIGVVLPVASIQIIFLGGFGIIFGLKAGAITGGFFFCILPFIAVFCSMYALVTLAAMLFRTAGIVNVVALVHMLFLSGVLVNRERIVFSVIRNFGGRFIFDLLYYLLPQVSDLETSAANILSGDKIILTPYLLSLTSSAIMLTLAIRVFRQMDL